MSRKMACCRAAMISNVKAREDFPLSRTRTRLPARDRKLSAAAARPAADHDCVEVESFINQ